MYKKYITILLLMNGIILLTFFSIKGLQLNRIAATPAFKLSLEDMEEEKGTSYLGLMAEAASGQRVISYSVVEQEAVYELTKRDYEALVRIVEAEAGCEDETGKLLVANVVLNRVKSEDFPDTVEEVVLQKSDGVTQFSPVSTGSFYHVNITEETIDVVNRAIMGEDVSEGALYFAARKYADPGRMRWFDEHLTFLFAYGGHEFFS